jgi:hypothetical protein
MDLHERTMQLKISAEDAGWSIREAAWNLEERVLWRSSDAARSRLRRAASGFGNLVIRFFIRLRLSLRRLMYGRLPRVTAAFRRIGEPIQRQLETKLLWPLSDAWHEHGLIARTSAMALLATAAIAAGIAGKNIGAGGSSSESPVTAAAPVAAVDLSSSDPTTLQGVAPEFAPAEAPATPGAVPEPAPQPTGPGPAAVAWRFSQAFVDYEIGRPGAKTGLVFAETAVPELADALSEDPPRLPHGTPVPEAKVLNVVLADETPKQVIASVSLLRVGSVSEVRLTVRLDPKDKTWKVAEVLG